MTAPVLVESDTVPYSSSVLLLPCGYAMLCYAMPCHASLDLLAGPASSSIRHGIVSYVLEVDHRLNPFNPPQNKEGVDGLRSATVRTAFLA